MKREELLYVRLPFGGEGKDQFWEDCREDLYSLEEEPPECGFLMLKFSFKPDEEDVRAIEKDPEHHGKSAEEKRTLALRHKVIRHYEAWWLENYAT